MWTVHIRFALPDMRTPTKESVFAMKCWMPCLVVQILWLWKVQGLSIKDVTYCMKYQFDWVNILVDQYTVKQYKALLVSEWNVADCCEPYRNKETACEPYQEYRLGWWCSCGLGQACSTGWTGSLRDAVASLPTSRPSPAEDKTISTALILAATSHIRISRHGVNRRYSCCMPGNTRCFDIPQTWLHS